MPALNSHIRQRSNWCSHAACPSCHQISISVSSTFNLCLFVTAITFSHDVDVVNVVNIDFFSFSHLPFYSLPRKCRWTTTLQEHHTATTTMPNHARTTTTMGSRDGRLKHLCLKHLYVFFVCFLPNFFCLLNILDYHDKRSHQCRATS